jgi:hypothetical protein
MISCSNYLPTQVFQHDFKIKFDELLELNQNANEIYLSNGSLGTPRYVTKPPMPN